MLDRFDTIRLTYGYDVFVDPVSQIQLQMLIKSVHVNVYANVSTKIFVILFKVTLKSMITKWVQETINVW